MQRYCWNASSLLLPVSNESFATDSSRPAGENFWNRCCLIRGYSEVVGPVVVVIDVVDGEDVGLNSGWLCSAECGESTLEEDIVTNSKLLID